MKLNFLEHRKLAAARFGTAFRRLMKATGLNREAIELRSGISMSSLNRMLYGGHNFSIYQAAALCASMGYELRVSFVPGRGAVLPLPEKYDEWCPCI